MATQKKTTKKAAGKKTTAKPAAKKAAVKVKKAVKPKAVVKKEPPVDLKDLDRKALAARARQLKTELLAIRFNLQNPSLKDYRIKKRELATLLGALN